MTEFVDGRRWPTRAVSPDPDRPSPVDASRSAGPEPQTGSAPPLPRFDVKPGFCMVTDTIALHFPADTAGVLALLFPEHADALHAAALDVEQEAEAQTLTLRDRQIGGRL